MNPILQYVNIETIINMLGLKLKKHGHYWQGCCPLHGGDNKNAFSIHEDGYYTCFSHCGGGSINNLVWKLVNQSIYKFLDINDINSFMFQNSLSQKKDNKKRECFEITKEHKDINIKGSLLDININTNKTVLDYLKLKKVPEEFCKAFNIKYVINAEINETTFKNRIVIPIIENNKIIAYEGRDFTNKQKPKVLYNKDSNVSTLFNIDYLDKNRPLIVCEGTFKIAEIWTYITNNVTCTFGSLISNKQKELLNEFKEIILFIDNDEAGLKMVSDFDEFYEKEYYIVVPPIKGTDPGDLSLEEKEQCLNNKIKSIDYFINKSGLFDEEENEIKW